MKLRISILSPNPLWKWVHITVALHSHVHIYILSEGEIQEIPQ